MLDVIQIRGEDVDDVKILKSIIKGYAMLIRRNRGFFQQARQYQERNEVSLRD
jgi:hypothetical protein